MRHRLLAAVAAAWFSAGAGAPAAPASAAPASAAPASAAPAKLTLSEAIARAYEASPDLASAAARIRKARLALDDLDAQRIAFNIGADAALNSSQGKILSSFDTPFPATPSYPASYGVKARLDVPLFPLSKLQETQRSLTSAEDAAKADREAARLALTLDVVKAFWALRQAQLGKEIQQQTLDQAIRAREIAKAGKAAGRQSDHDIDQADLAVVSAQSALRANQGAEDTARVQLADLVRLPAADLALAGDPPATPAAVEMPSPEAAEAALARRPDVIAARARLAQAKAGIGVAEADFWPGVGFSATYQHGLQPTDLGAAKQDPPAGTWTAGLTATYNLFDLGNKRRAAERAEQEAAEAKASLERIERRVRADIASSVARAQSAASRAQISERSVELAERNYEWALARKQQGYGLAIEVDDARTKLAVARSQRLNARIDYVTALAELQAALGTL